MAPASYLDSAEALEASCARWADAPVLALDTEFVRTRTFFPRLGLIQVAVGTEVALVDPLALPDLEPLARRLRDPRQLKVLHSASEDLEVLFHRFGELPAPLFDTQIAAALLGHGASPSYGNLVSRLLGIELPKAETRTDWLQRPLTGPQLHYAALDAAYLPPLHTRLAAELEARERTSWAEEELERLGNTERFLPPPDEAYLRLRPTAALNRRQLAALRELCAWREREARGRDLPRNHVVHEEALRQIARQLPRNPAALAKVRGLDGREQRRHGAALLAAVETALQIPNEALPSPPPKQLDLAPHRALLASLRDTSAAQAQALDLPAELLATRRQLEQLIRLTLENGTPSPPASLQGWRWNLLEPHLSRLLNNICHPSVAI